VSAPVLEFEDFTYTYPGAAVPALAEVTLAIGEGELCLVAGMTGQGKSTLLRAACGLVPHFHGGSCRGAVRVEGLDTRDHGPAQLGALVGVLFQDPETQLVMGSVRAELALALESRGSTASEVARAVEEVALALGVDHLLDRPTAELSGGEKQRVALGAALVGRPRIVLLDEPTSQLDPVAGDELIALLRRLNRDWGVTVMLAEHRLERCLADVDRVICVSGARVVHDGDPASFLRHASHHAPALETPGARMFSLAGLHEMPVGVREARALLRAAGLASGRPVGDEPAVGEMACEARAAVREEGVLGSVTAANGRARGAGARGRVRGRTRRGAARHEAGGESALRLRSAWLELDRGPAILRGVTLAVGAGESIALMGRNGSGKSTLLRLAAGLLSATRGAVERSGRVALLLQNPSDYLLHERVDQEASAAALAAVGLQGMGARHTRDLSGGERQRLALAIVTDSERPPAVLALDEPTRGMDRHAKSELAEALRRRAREGQAVIVATHDPEFAAAAADRVLLMADGRIIADDTASGMLSGGWYFATETARILGGAAVGDRSGQAAGVALLPEQGAALLRARRARPSVVEGARA